MAGDALLVITRLSEIIKPKSLFQGHSSSRCVRAGFQMRRSDSPAQVLHHQSKALGTVSGTVRALRKR